MNWHVVDVVPLAHLALQVRFADGLAGAVRLRPSHLTGVFTALADPGVFSRVFIDHGAVTWPGGLDLAPDAMHAAIRRHGEWVLD